MKTRTPNVATLAALMLAVVLAGCSSSADTDSSTEDLEGPGFELDSIGLRGMSWSGEATFRDPELVFPDSSLELSTSSLGLTTGTIDLGRFDDSELTYDGEPARLRVVVNALITEHEPGHVRADIVNVSPRYLDQEERALGSDSADRIKVGLARHGVTFPDPDSDDPIEVSLEIAASDEDYKDIVLSSDSDLLQAFRGAEGRKQSF